MLFFHTLSPTYDRSMLADMYDACITCMSFIVYFLSHKKVQLDMFSLNKKIDQD